MINHLKWNIQIKNLTLSDGIFHQWQKDKHKAGHWPNINSFCVRDFWHISVESLSPCRNCQKCQNTARDTSRSWVNLFTSLKTTSGFKCHFRFHFRFKLCLDPEWSPGDNDTEVWRDEHVSEIIRNASSENQKSFQTTEWTCWEFTWAFRSDKEFRKCESWKRNFFIYTDLSFFVPFDSQLNGNFKMI